MEEPEFEGIEVAVSGARGELHLNRPEKLNPLSHDTLRDLVEAARWFNAHPDLKVVVVAGRGRAFSAGADLTAFAGSTAKDAWSRRRDADAGRLMADALENVTAVTIAKIHGHCVGGGVVLAGACDLRIAAEGTRFSIPEVDLGIPLAWGGIPRLVRDIGPALTKELVMTCRPFDAAEAREAGFLNRVVPAEQLDREVEELAVLLESKPKLALLATKRHTNAVTEEMVGTMRSWSDADGLLAGLGDTEGNESAARYLARISGSADAEGPGSQT
jgi:enoyl-CoA hydratase/carnithine racemase